LLIIGYKNNKIQTNPWFLLIFFDDLFVFLPFKPLPGPHLADWGKQ